MIARVADWLFLSVIGLCVGVGIPASQQWIDLTSARFILNVPFWGDRGLPFIAGLVSAALTGICVLFTARRITMDRVCLGVCTAAMATAAIGLIVPRSLEPRYSVWIPGVAFVFMLIWTDRRDFAIHFPGLLVRLPVH